MYVRAVMFPLPGTQNMSKGDFHLDGSPQDARAMLIAYITGTLSPEERESFDRRVLEDEFFSQQIEELQFQLVDEYVAGSLPEPLRHAVGAWIASSEHWKQHAEITRALVKLSSSSADRRALRRVATTVAAAIFVTAAITYSWVRLHRTNSAPRTVATVAVNAQHPAAHRPDTVLLIAERLRSVTPSDTKPLVYRVHRDTPVRLQVVLPPSHTSNDYAVALRQEQTGQLTNLPRTTVQGPTQAPFLELMLPPNTLKAGNYTAQVSAPNDSYQLRFQIAN